MIRYIAALLLSFVAVSGARADWLNVAVANAPTGPFGATANLWTQSLLTVDLAAESGSPIVFNGTAYIPLGLLSANFGKPDGPPTNFPWVPFAFQVPGKLVISGQLSALSNGKVYFQNVTPSDPKFIVTLEAMGRPGPASAPPPGLADWPLVVQNDIYAVVPVSELAQTPEPSTIVLAGIGALIFAVRRKIF